MRITPLRGLSIADVHAPSGVPVDAPDALARELVSLGVAVFSPPEEAPAPAPQPEPVRPAPIIETATAEPRAERATTRPARNRIR